MDGLMNNQLENRDNRDLIIMLVTKLDNIENLVENLKTEARADYEDLQNRMLIRAQEYTNELNHIKDQVEELQLELERKYINKETFNDHKHDVEKKYVSKDIFQPVKAIVYGITGASLMGVLYALLKLINLGAK